MAATDEQAQQEFWPHCLKVIRHISKTRGFAVPTNESFMHEIGPQGALHVGSPETVAQKIADTITGVGANRFDLKYGMGGLSHQALLTNIPRSSLASASSWCDRNGSRTCDPEGSRLATGGCETRPGSPILPGRNERHEGGRREHDRHI